MAKRYLERKREERLQRAFEQSLNRVLDKHQSEDGAARQAPDAVMARLLDVLMLRPDSTASKPPVNSKEAIKQAGIGLSKWGLATLGIVVAYFVAKWSIGVIAGLIPPGRASAFYASVGVFSGGVLLATAKEALSAIGTFLKSKGYIWVEFFIYVFTVAIAILALLMATRALEQYRTTRSIPNVSFLFTSATSPVSSADQSLFRFHTLFLDPYLESAPGGSNSILNPDDSSRAVNAGINRDFLRRMRRVLASCAEPGGDKVELEIYGFASSDLFVQSISESGEQTYLDRSHFERMLLDESDDPVAAKRIREARDEIQTIVDSGRASNHAQAFNLWIAQKRADAVCRQLSENPEESIDCASYNSPSIHIIDKTSALDWNEMQLALNRLENNGVSPQDPIQPDGPDRRLFSRSVEVRVLGPVPRCEIPRL